MHIGYWWESQKARRPRRRWVDNIKMDIREGGMVWIEFIWLRIGIRGGVP
jgi:hypothetical protein